MTGWNRLDDPSPQLLQQAAASFGLLASTMRLHIVWVLTQGEADVGTLAERVGGTLQAVSQHLAKLKLAGMVSNRREGRRQVYGVDDPQVATLVRLMVEKLDTAGHASGHRAADPFAGGGELRRFRSSGA
jgi:DNA-binding transcriptional ArsR family regulator